MFIHSRPASDTLLCHDLYFLTIVEGENEDKDAHPASKAEKQPPIFWLKGAVQVEGQRVKVVDEKVVRENISALIFQGGCLETRPPRRWPAG